MGVHFVTKAYFLRGVITESNVHCEITSIRIILKSRFFRDNFRPSSVEAAILFASVHPPPKGDGKVIFGDGADDPITAHLEALLGL